MSTSGTANPRQRVLITGASSGIGEAFARHYAARNHDIVLVGRDIAALERVSLEITNMGVRAEIIVADLSTPAGVEQVGASAGVIDRVVANAGITHAASIGTTDRDELDRLAYLMSTGVARLCEIFVPGMMTRGHGSVVIVSSIASFTPMRKAAPYAASKSYATAYARSLALEVQPKGIKVVAVCPGYVHTNLHERAGLDHLNRSVPSWMWLEPIDVVIATERALKRGRVVVVPGLVYRLVLPFLSSRIAQGIWKRLTRRR